jgi:hypothetical protein
LPNALAWADVVRGRNIEDSKVDTAPHPFIVAIGASGGEGLNDIEALLTRLPKPVKAVVMVVLHRPSDRISALRDVLGRRSGLPVVVAEQAEAFESGVGYIGEPDQHLTLGWSGGADLLAGAATGFATGPSTRCSCRSPAMPGGERSVSSCPARWTTDRAAWPPSTRRAASPWCSILGTSARDAAERHRSQRPDQRHRRCRADRRIHRPAAFGAGHALRPSLATE